VATENVTMSRADELAKLDRLRARGVLSKTEFEAEKAKVLASGGASPSPARPKKRLLTLLLAIAAFGVLIVIAVKVLSGSDKSVAGSTATTTTTTAAPVATTLPALAPLGISFTQEKAFASSLHVGAISWRSSPLSGGEPRSIGTDEQALLIFATIGPTSDLSQVDVEAFVGSASSAIGKDQLLALGEMAYQFGGVPASKWVGTEITASVRGSSIQSSAHKATLFGGYTVEVQTTAGDKSAQTPPTISVQVTRR
jgi:hypothetical protein